MEYQPWDQDADEEENNEEESQEFTSEKDSVLFLIDSRLAMLQPTDPEKSSQVDASENSEQSTQSQDSKPQIPFHGALKCAQQIYMDKVISSPTDLVGVVFFGTKAKHNQFDFENVFMFHDLDCPDAQRIKDIENLRVEKDLFDQQIGHATSDKANLFEALWTCQSLFSHIPKNVGYKRIFLFTNDDNPVGNSGELKKKCVEKAKDLIESDITIELFAIKKKDEEFDSFKFWRHIIPVSDDDYTGRITFDFSAKMEEMMEKVRRKEFKKRSLGRLDFTLADNVTLKVRMYNTVMKATKSSYQYLDADTNKPVKCETKQICEETGSELLPGDIISYVPYGGAKVEFTKDEVKLIKKLSPAGIRLIGFKPKSRVKLYHNIKHASFLYPDDEEITGSTTAFVALHQKMLEMDKVAIARVTARENAQPRYVALLPQAEVLDADGTQIQGPGFHMLFLPFQDDIRSLSIQPTEKASEEQVYKAKKIVQKLYIDFDSNNFENPVIQQHFVALQALALEHETVEQVPDHLMPDEQGMEKYKALYEDFVDSVYPEGYDPEVAAGVTKKPSTRGRGRGGSTSTRGTKRKVDDSDEEEKAPAKRGKSVKKEQEDDDMETDGHDWAKLASNGTLDKLTIPELKVYLDQHKLKKTGKKAELVERITEHLTKQGKL